MRKDYYQILGVAPNAEAVVIRAAYRALAQRYHPDKMLGDVAKASLRMRAIQEAYEVLGDEMRRAQYDQGRDNSIFATTFSSPFPSPFTSPFSAELDLGQLPSGTMESQAWSALLRLYPHLGLNLAQLEKTNSHLAQTYRTLLLEFISEKLVARMVNQVCQEMESINTIDTPLSSTQTHLDSQPNRM
jgi:curved DNA-binding protein CbpA